MTTNASSTTYVIGRTDGLIFHLCELTRWLQQDAAERSSSARVVFLGGVVHGVQTSLITDEAIGVLEKYPGSSIIQGCHEKGLLDFLEGNLNPSPAMRWMAHGGRKVVSSFVIEPTGRRYADIRRQIMKASPSLLGVLRDVKEYEIEGDFCFADAMSSPPPLVGDGPLWSGFAEDHVARWKNAVKKIIVHESIPSHDRYPEVEDSAVLLGGFPAQTGRVQMLTIENGRASRFVFASRDAGSGNMAITVKPVEMFRKAPHGAARFA